MSSYRKTASAPVFFLIGNLLQEASGASMNTERPGKEVRAQTVTSLPGRSGAEGRFSGFLQEDDTAEEHSAGQDAEDDTAQEHSAEAQESEEKENEDDTTAEKHSSGQDAEEDTFEEHSAGHTLSAEHSAEEENLENRYDSPLRRNALRGMILFLADLFGPLHDSCCTQESRSCIYCMPRLRNVYLPKTP